MVCPLCGGNTRVVNSRKAGRANNVWRRRQCEACKQLFSTHETAILEGLYKVQRPTGRLEPFQPDKIFLDLINSLKSRPHHVAEARQLTTTAVAKIVDRRKEAIIPVSEVGEAVATVLKNFDKSAWVSYLTQHPSVPRPKRFTWR